MEWPEEFLDNVVLESEQFAPYIRGKEVMTIKAGEQIMISVAFMALEAVNQGLGSCWVGAISPREAANVMGLPDDMFVHDLFVLGYPDEDPKPRPRKEFDKIVFWEKCD
jgi:nitroreductase